MSLESLYTDPLFSLLLTLCSFSAFVHLQKKAGGHTLLNPVGWSIFTCVLFIYITGIDYADYMEGAQMIHFLLGPVIVALAVPLYKFLDQIKKDAVAIILTTLIMSPVAGFGAYALLVGLGTGNEDLLLAIIPKSTTTPIGIEISNKISSVASLTVMFVIMTGVTGALLATPLFKILGIKDEKVQGLAIGIICHGIGSSRAFQISERAGTYGVIGMGLMGIISGFLLPILVITFLH
ncbi:MAG: LrgB family protein [Alphaproteobacteria bacterium]